MATLRKSKGSNFSEWKADLLTTVGQDDYWKFIGTDFSQRFYNQDKTPTEALTEIFLLVEDKENEKILAIYPMSKRSQFKGLRKCIGYVERNATAKEIEEKPHCVYTKKAREKKDRSTPLFGDLPEVRKP